MRRELKGKSLAIIIAIYDLPATALPWVLSLRVG
jgi:hypothetical protein